jgi:hypothetical protein
MIKKMRITAYQEQIQNFHQMKMLVDDRRISMYRREKDA